MTLKRYQRVSSSWRRRGPLNPAHSLIVRLASELLLQRIFLLGSGRRGDLFFSICCLLRPSIGAGFWSMGFISFAGRVLFASIFLLSAYQEFNEYGIDGGPTARALRPKYNLFIRRVTTTLGMELPKVEVKHIVAANITLKGIGGLLFILSSSFGASLLLLHLALTAPILYDFYNHDIEKPEFAQLFGNFTQNLAFFGALLFYLGMKNSLPRRQGKKRAPKPKTL